jgi:phosphoribosyl 1,2-cyclic phosphodiesterase
MRRAKARRRAAAPSQFDVWGSRGSRSLFPHRSQIANHTSCYSLLHGEDLFLLDAGRGLASLSGAMRSNGRFAGVKRIHVLVSHAHLDHWEGLKDADWFWERGNGLEVSILGTAQALKAIRTGYAHPLYVALELLGARTVKSLRYRTLKPGQRRRLGDWLLMTQPLRHYSGSGRSIWVLDTLGYKLRAPDGATVAYLCDHEPNRSTQKVERALLQEAHLAVYDAHFPDILHHEHGHGSQEHAAGMARAHPKVLVLAGHHGPFLTDLQIRAAHRRHGRRTPNFRLAVEGASYRWDPVRASFVPKARAR